MEVGIPTVNTQKLINKYGQPPSGRKYFDTKSGNWFKNENSYLNAKYLRETGRTRSQQRSRNARLRASGKSPRTRTTIAETGDRRRGVAGVRRYRSQRHYIIIEGSRNRNLVAIDGRYGRLSGYVQVFVPAESYPPGGMGGSPGFGPNPLTGGQQVRGFWVTRSADRINDLSPWVRETDPLNLMSWRTLVRISQ